jgi:hypothetical protein
VTGTLFPPAGRVLAWTARPFLTYTISGARLFTGLPAASIPVSLSGARLIAIYALTFGLTRLGWKGWAGYADDDNRWQQKLIKDTRLFKPVGLKITRVSSLNQIIFAFLARDLLSLFVHSDERNIIAEASI